MRRVVQFSTGNVGVHSLPAIIGRPDLELVGVHAASPNKIGRDAAELCGLSEPTGIIATDDIDALIALKPDCVVYTAQGETRPMEVIEQMSKFLSAGINIVATSMVWLVTPRQADDWLRVPLEQACAAGNASLYVNGIDPGYSGDTEVHSALSLVTRARAITVQEIFDYANYDDYEFTGKQMGFGVSAEDDTPMLFLPGVLTTMWGGAVRNLAEQLGVQLDEVRQRIEPWYTDKRIECKMATVEPGQMAAVKFAVEGVRDGVPVITMEHITRLTADSAPDWLYPPDGRPGVHRVVVDGDPRVELNTHVSHPGLDVTEAGCLSTAARVVNAIDWVCRAPAGLIAVEDIPAGRNHSRTDVVTGPTPSSGRAAGKRVLITGAARGLGRSHALRLAEEGADLILIDLCESLPEIEYDLATQDDLAETVRLVAEYGGRCVSRVADVRDEAALRSAVDEGVDELGGLDSAVANAGVLTVAPWDRTTSDHWRTVVDVNLIGTWNTCAVAIPHLLAQGGGSLVNISSAGAMKGFPLQIPYTASKYGVVGLTIALANELAAQSIRVNSVHPTGTPTGMVPPSFGATLGEERPDLIPMFVNAMPTPCIEPVDVSNAVLFLISDESRFVTGLQFKVDAGVSIN